MLNEIDRNNIHLAPDRVDFQFLIHHNGLLYLLNYLLHNNGHSYKMLDNLDMNRHAIVKNLHEINNSNFVKKHQVSPVDNIH